MQSGKEIIGSIEQMNLNRMENYMSIQNFNKAIKLINENKNKCDIIGKRSDQLVGKCEKMLELMFSPQYRNFVLNYGAISIGAEEIYGVVDDNFINSMIPNGVWHTLSDRIEFNFPQHLFVIANTGFDEILCLDFSRLNKEGEPPVVVFAINIDNEDQNYEVVSEDFGEYLLQVIETELE